MRKPIAIYGAGGFGRETALLITQINQKSAEWELTGFFDDGIPKGSKVGEWKVLGGMADLVKAGGINIVMAIAEPQLRKQLSQKIKNQSISFPILVHPTCQVGDPMNRIDQGCILTAGVILTTGVVLEEFTILNLLTTIGHDVTVGGFSTIMPGCSISGNVKIGECVMMGTGARILQNLNIGAHARIGAGAVVTREVMESKTVLGIPAREHEE